MLLIFILIIIRPNIPLLPHSFRLKTFLFCKTFPIVAFLFFFRTSGHGFPGLFTDTSEHVSCLVFSFPVFHFLVVGSVR